MKTVWGETVSFEGSVLIRITFIGAGAGNGRFSDSAAVWPDPTVPALSSTSLPASVIVTLAIVSARFGSALA